MEATEIEPFPTPHLLYRYIYFIYSRPKCTYFLLVFITSFVGLSLWDWGGHVQRKKTAESTLACCEWKEEDEGRTIGKSMLMRSVHEWWVVVLHLDWPETSFKLTIEKLAIMNLNRTWASLIGSLSVAYRRMDPSIALAAWVVVAAFL